MSIRLYSFFLNLIVINVFPFTASTGCYKRQSSDEFYIQCTVFILQVTVSERWFALPPVYCKIPDIGKDVYSQFCATFYVIQMM